MEIDKAASFVWDPQETTTIIPPGSISVPKKRGEIGGNLWFLPSKRMQCLFSLPSKSGSFFRYHKSYHHLLFSVMSRVVEAVTSEQPLLRLLEGWQQLGLYLHWPFVTFIPWKSPSATLEKLICIPGVLPWAAFSHPTGHFPPCCQGFMDSATYRLWKEVGSRITKCRAGGRCCCTLSQRVELNWNYPAIIHSSLGEVGENPFISMRNLKFASQTCGGGTGRGNPEPQEWPCSPKTGEFLEN